MKPIPAIVESANDLAAEQVIVWRTEERDAETSAARWEQQAGAARETAKVRRLQIGELCAKQREKWPQSGPNARGWGLWLAKAKLDDSTAWRYIDAWKSRDKPGDDVGDPSHSGEVRGNSDDDEPDDGGPRIRPLPGRMPEPPPFRQLTEEDLEQAIARLDPEVRDRLLRRARVNVSGGSGDSERATWRTSKLWAERVGSWDLDPFSNPRSVILSVARCMLEDGGDGFGGGEPGVEPGRYLTGSGHGQQPIGGVAGASTRVWLQPPYTNGFVERVVAHYGHTRFCALLRLDPSTEWFAALWERTKLLAIPIGTREMFEPPPGVKASSNPQPHAFYYSDPRDVAPAIAETCILLNRYEALRLVR